MSLNQKSVLIIGAGPAGLMAAESLAMAGIHVSVYDSMPSVARKFLLAGKGGLNITHAESLPDFLGRYPSLNPRLQHAIEAWDAESIRSWMQSLGISSFVGSSGRVFPEEMKSAPLLRAWLRRLRALGVVFHTGHQWVGWSTDGEWLFKTTRGDVAVQSTLGLLSLGGASWPRLGSTGAWQSILRSQGILVHDLRSSNAGFNRAWSDYFRQKYAGTVVQSVRGYASNEPATDAFKGEITITEYGLEGGLVYAASSYLSQQIRDTNEAYLYVDLLPEHTLDKVTQLLSSPQGTKSRSTFLRSKLGLSPVKISLFNECVPKTARLDSPSSMATLLKSLPIKLDSIRPIEEAISSAGGVAFDELNDDFMLQKKPGVFCAGEMLDWDAPTGGYLLTACFASGRAAAQGIKRLINT